VTPPALLSGKPPGPLVDHHCTLALDNALQQLAFHRFIAPTSTPDATIQLHLLASLMELAHRWLHEEVNRARQAGASWADIGRLLGVPAATARANHSPTKPRHPATAPHPRRSTQTSDHTEVMPLATH
jgi:hypothetical protein